MNSDSKLVIKTLTLVFLELFFFIVTTNFYTKYYNESNNLNIFALLLGAILIINIVLVAAEKRKAGISWIVVAIPLLIVLTKEILVLFLTIIILLANTFRTIKILKEKPIGKSKRKAYNEEFIKLKNEIEVIKKENADEEAEEKSVDDQ